MENNELPKGVWYDAERKRYRVRFYRKGVIQHISYHPTAEEAIEEHNRCNQMRVEEPDLVSNYIQQSQAYYRGRKNAAQSL